MEFIVENKTDVELSFQMGTVALDGFSYNVSGSEDVAARSKGYIKFYSEDPIPTSGVEKISGKIKVIDFSDMWNESRNYEVAFSDVWVS